MIDITATNYKTSDICSVDAAEGNANAGTIETIAAQQANL